MPLVFAVPLTEVGAPGTLSTSTSFVSIEPLPVHPSVLVAATVKVYRDPGVSPVTVALVPDPVTMVGDPGSARTALRYGVTVLEVTVQPHGTHPAELGAVQLTDSLSLMLERAVAAVGAVGAVPSVTWFDATEAGLVPSGLNACTVKVYAVPTVSPDTVVLLSVVPPTASPVQVPHAGDGVTVLPWIPPPLFAGSVQLTVTLPLVMTTAALTAVGAPGAIIGVSTLDAGDDGPVPMALVAWTVNVYPVPTVPPVTMVLGTVPLEVNPEHPGQAGDGITV